MPPEGDSHDAARRSLLKGLTAAIALLAGDFRGLIAAPLGGGEQLQFRRTLTTLAHDLFPHKGLAIGHYEAVAALLLDEAAKDDGIAAQLRAGIAALEKGEPPWADRSEEGRVAAIERIAGSRFFSLARTKSIEQLYRDKAVWRLLGYEGSSVEYGGYVDRGFDDIDWLPDGKDDL